MVRATIFSDRNIDFTMKYLALSALTATISTCLKYNNICISAFFKLTQAQNYPQRRMPQCLRRVCITCRFDARGASAASGE